MGNWIKKTFKKYSYVFNLVLVVAALAFAGVTIYQCVQIKNYYSVRQTEMTQIKNALISLEQYVAACPPTEGNPVGAQIEIAYPSTIDDLDEISDVLSIVQEDNAQAMSRINNHLLIFSILITVVTIIIPILNYAFIQKDQIKRLDKQYKKSKEELKVVKEASEQAVARLNEQYEEYSRKSHDELIGIMNKSEQEIKRVQNQIDQMTDISKNLIGSKSKRDQEPVVAITKVNPISESVHDRATAHAINAKLHFVNDNYKQALIETNKAIELEPDEAENYSFRCVLMNVLNQYDKALSDIDKAISIEPENAWYYYNRGQTLHMLKRSDDALEATEKAIELDSNDAAFYRNKASILLDIKRYSDALAAAKKAIDLKPEVTSYYISSTALFLMKRYKEATQELEEALKLDSEEPKTYHLFAVQYHTMSAEAKAKGNDEEAQKYDEEAKKYGQLAKEKGYIPEPDDEV